MGQQQQQQQQQQPKLQKKPQKQQQQQQEQKQSILKDKLKKKADVEPQFGSYNVADFDLKNFADLEMRFPSPFLLSPGCSPLISPSRFFLGLSSPANLVHFENNFTHPTAAAISNINK